MKLVIHDFAGHPFQTLLSSELAKRGLEVFHVYFKGDQGPKENLSSKIIQQTKSGYVVAPQDKKGFVRSISKLMKNENERNEMGNNARLYAEERFDIRNVTDSFEDIFFKVLKRSY